MCETDLKLGVLPEVLQNLVLEFAFNLPKQAIVDSLRIILGIIDMDLPFFFFRDKIWSWHYRRCPCFVHAHRILQPRVRRAVRRRCFVLFAPKSGFSTKKRPHVWVPATLARPHRDVVEVRRAVRRFLQNADAVADSDHETHLPAEVLGPLAAREAGLHLGFCLQPAARHDRAALPVLHVR